MIYWVFLLAAIGFEVTAQSFLKYSNGWSRSIPSLFACVFFLMSPLVYAFALKKIDVSTAYPIWSGIGTVCIAIIGVLIFKENISVTKGIFMGIIVVGIIGVMISS